MDDPKRMVRCDHDADDGAELFEPGHGSGVWLDPLPDDDDGDDAPADVSEG